MNLHILGIGTALPEHVMSQTEAAALGGEVCCRTEEQARLLNVLYRRSGVQSRRTVLPYGRAREWIEAEREAAGGVAVSQTLGPTTRERMELYQQHAAPLALQAATGALEEACEAAAEITHLITVSCTGFAAPSVEVALIKQLGLPPTVERTHVGFMGCHGAINGLRVAQALAGSHRDARVLLCAYELCSLHYRFDWDPAKIVGNAIFADGAAAIVCAAADSDLAGSWQVSKTGSCVLPDSEDAMSWLIGDHGFEMSLSPRVPDLICRHLPGWLAGWLARRGLTIESVASWAVHPGGPRIVSAVEEALGLSGEATAVSRQVLAEYGNMSSPTVLFILDRLRRQNAPRPCVALAFGPGLAAETALIE